MAEYIEREALLHDIEQSVVYTAREKITSAEMRGAHKVIERIKCAPAVEPIYIHEPTKSKFKRLAAQMGYVPVVHGQWIRPHWKNSDYCCDFSKCGGEAMHREYQWNKKGIYPICPNCGAKMEGDADNA
jgi:hypothetical protein